VEALASQLGLEQELRIEVDVGAAEVLAERAKAALYQIIREALDASIRRGPPSVVSVTVTELEDRTMELVISDDAPGERRRAAFEPITERVNTLNGTIAIESPPQGGTTIRVKLPSYASRFTG